MSESERLEREWLEGLRYEDKFPERAPTWQCEFCGRFYSERTAKDHAHCVQAYDRECFEKAFPYG